MKISKAIGKMACLCCGETITVKQADTGTVSVSCPDCDFSGYGKNGTEAHRKIMARVTLKAAGIDVQPAPAPKPAPAAPHAGHRPASAKPAPAMPSAAVIAKNTVFG
jgi:hypothetical protein